MLFEPGNDVFDVDYCALRSADGMLKGLQGERAQWVKGSRLKDSFCLRET